MRIRASSVASATTSPCSVASGWAARTTAARFPSARGDRARRDRHRAGRGRPALAADAGSRPTGAGRPVRGSRAKPDRARASGRSPPPAPARTKPSDGTASGRRLHAGALGLGRRAAGLAAAWPPCGRPSPARAPGAADAARRTARGGSAQERGVRPQPRGHLVGVVLLHSGRFGVIQAYGRSPSPSRVIARQRRRAGGSASGEVEFPTLAEPGRRPEARSGAAAAAVPGTVRLCGAAGAGSAAGPGGAGAAEPARGGRRGLGRRRQGRPRSATTG